MRVDWLEFPAFMRERLGPGWAICRNTPRNRERHGTCISPQRYQKLREEFASGFRRG